MTVTSCHDYRAEVLSALLFFFFFKQKTAYEIVSRDWSSDVCSSDLDVQMPDVDPEAKQHYGQAVERYTEAEQALDRARRPEDIEPVTSALEEGRWAMSAAKAELAGERAPGRRGPRFF